MLRFLLSAVIVLTLVTDIAEARMFGRRFFSRSRSPVCGGKCQAPSSPTPSPRYETRYDGNTCRRVRIE
jgi:hypothetical protein